MSWYYRTVVMQTVWRWHKNRLVDQTDRTEGLNVSTCSVQPLDLWQKYQKYTPKHHSTNGAGETISTSRRTKLDLYLSPWTKANFVWNEDSNKKIWNTETVRRQHKENPTKYRGKEELSEQDFICLRIKANNWQIALDKIKKLLYNYGNNWMTRKPTQ